jgi:hypothetical protein
MKEGKENANSLSTVELLSRGTSKSGKFLEVPEGLLGSRRGTHSDHPSKDGTEWRIRAHDHPNARPNYGRKRLFEGTQC